MRGHNEALYFWQELISVGKLSKPFDVVHVDTHADLGLGYGSWTYMFEKLLGYPVDDRAKHAEYKLGSTVEKEGIGDYLLYAIAYRMVSSLTYCGNPNKQCNDYNIYTLRDFEEEYVFQAGEPVQNTIQLLYNKNQFPFNGSEIDLRRYREESTPEPEIPFLIIPRIEDVHYSGDFDFAVMAQSPNYTPVEADFIMDLFKEYIEEV